MSVSIPSLVELFPDGNYEFHLTLRRSEPKEFFQPIDATGAVLAERARWLTENPARYATLEPAGQALLEEFARISEGWTPPVDWPVDREAAVQQLGRSFEPDILFLTREPDGEFRLRGGALCFPTSWALEEKLGQTLESIHGVVPGLNAALGPAIRQFLTKLKPGLAYLRHNWGLAATDELNLHPARKISGPTLPVRLDRLWLRVEHQALAALPGTRGIVFGIRIANHRLDHVAAGPAAAGFRRALETMPFELASYKRLDHVRGEIMQLL